MESAILGLAVIIIAWIFQLVYSWKGKKEIQSKFLTIYAIGSALLIIDCYLNELKWTGIFNTVILMLSLIVLIKVTAKEKTSFKARAKKRR